MTGCMQDQACLHCRAEQSDLAEELLEKSARQSVPGDGVGRCRENPVQLAEWSFAIGLLSRNPVNQVFCEALAAQEAFCAEPSQCHLPGTVADEKPCLNVTLCAQQQLEPNLSPSKPLRLSPCNSPGCPFHEVFSCPLLQIV